VKIDQSYNYQHIHMYNGWQCSHLIVLYSGKASEFASFAKLANAYAWWMAACRFKFSKLLLPSNDVHETCCSQLQLADDEFNVRSQGTLCAVPELPRNSRLSTTPSCPVSEGFIRVCLAKTSQFESNSSFNVQRSVSARLRPHSWFSQLSIL